MNDIDGQNAKFSDDEEVQITDLDVPDSLLHRRIVQITGLIRMSLRTPWILYSFSGTLILILLGAFFLQWRQLTPTTPKVAKAPTAEFLSATTTQEMVFIQDTNHLLTAYQATTGHVRWHTSLPDTATIDAEGQILYCYFATATNKTELEALDTNTGKVIWQDALPTSQSSSWPSSFTSEQITIQEILNTPGPSFFYSDNTIYIQNTDNIIYTIQASSGRLKGSYQSPTIDYSIIDGQILYALQPPISSTIQAFRLSDGQPLWMISLPQGTWAQAESDGVIYLNTAEGTTLVALRGSDGHQLWRYYTKAEVSTIFNAYDGIVYLLQQDNMLVKIRVSDGSALWRVRLTIPQNFVGLTTKLLVDHDNILLYDALPGVATPVYVFQASDGHLLWHTSGPVVNPVPLNGVLYAMQSDGRLDAWRESDGYHLWSYRAPDGTQIVQNARHDPTLLFLLNDTGTFYALRASDGKLLWHYH
jgi:outer membrane protein assembly factor BamB